MNMNRGLFVVVEGRDGSGKTVLVEVIMEYMLSELSLNVMETKEPGSGSVLGNDIIRNLIFGEGKSFDNVTQGLLFFIDHYRHAVWVRERIENGVSVISDRWLYSQYAYQAVKEARQIDANFLYRKYEEVQIKPDLLFILDCSEEVTRERLQGRTGKDIAQEDKAWGDHEKVDAAMREEYRKIYTEYKGKQEGVFWITQNGKEAPSEVFHSQIKSKIDAFLERREEIEEVLKKLILSVDTSAPSWISMPPEISLQNANILCDTASGACSCGATHSIRETIDRIRELS